MTLKNKIIVIGAVVLVVIAGVAVKWFFFPSVKDDYFVVNQRSLREIPSGLLIVRPTHFPNSVRKGIRSDSIEISGKQVQWTRGRNVTFEQLMAFAYNHNVDRVVLPAIVPHDNFDFLITVPGDQSQQLQAAIRKKLGYTAQTEMRNEEVLALKIQDASLPGLTVSDASSKQGVNFRDGKLFFTRFRLQELTEDFEQTFKEPVVDKTELTNSYNFSIVWNSQMQRQLNNETNAPAAVKGIISGWGLKLVPDNDQVEMVVVKSAG